MDAHTELLIARIVSNKDVFYKQAFMEGLEHLGEVSEPQSWGGKAWNMATGLLPGVGTIQQGAGAINDFGKGNYWSGAGKALGAGLSLIPGIGGGAGKMVNGLTKGLGFGVKSVAPKLMGKVPSLASGISRGANFLEHADTGIANSIGKLPGVRSMVNTGVGKTLGNNPGRTMLGSGLISSKLEGMQSAQNEGKQMASEGMNNMVSNFRQYASSGAGNYDPRYAGPSNPRL